MDKGQPVSDHRSTETLRLEPCRLRGFCITETSYRSQNGSVVVSRRSLVNVVLMAKRIAAFVFMVTSLAAVAHEDPVGDLDPIVAHRVIGVCPACPLPGGPPRRAEITALAREPKKLPMGTRQWLRARAWPCSPTCERHLPWRDRARSPGGDVAGPVRMLKRPGSIYC